MITAREAFFAKHPELTHADKTFLASLSAADYAASWFCTPEFIGQTNMDMGTGLKHTLDIFAHSFSQRQEKLLEAVGSYSH
jgi:hypothetical protein